MNVTARSVTDELVLTRDIAAPRTERLPLLSPALSDERPVPLCNGVPMMGNA